jgi:hypothetical protein
MGPTGLQEGFIDKSEGYNGPQTGSKGWDKPMGGSIGDFIGDSIGDSIGGSIGPTGPTGLQEGFIDKSEGCNSLQIGSEGCNEPIGGSTDDPIGDPIGDPISKPIGNSTGDSIGNSMPIDWFCSSYNQKKPLIDFGRFLTYNPCR